MLGVFATNCPPTLPASELLWKEVSVLPSMVYCAGSGSGAGAQRADFEEALELLTSRPWLKELLVSHTFELQDAKQAFEVGMGKGASGAAKVMIRC